MDNNEAQKHGTQPRNQALIEADIKTFMELLSLLEKSSSMPEEWKEQILGADYKRNKFLIDDNS
jgi:hypothetical protein